MFTFVYLALNIGTVVMHWFLSAGVFKWIKEAPLPVAEAKAEAVEVKADEKDGDGEKPTF